VQRSFLVSPTPLCQTTCTVVVRSLPRCCGCTSEIAVRVGTRRTIGILRVGVRWGALSVCGVV